MKKSTIIILIILLVCFGGMMFLLDFYSAGLREDIEVGNKLTRWALDRGDLAERTKVRVGRRKPQEGREGTGLLAEVTPSEATAGRPGGLRALALALAGEAARSYPETGPAAIRWVELRLLSPGRNTAKTVLRRSEGSQFGEPEPALPEVWPPGPSTGLGAGSAGPSTPR